MLDTNIVSQFIRAQSEVDRHIVAHNMDEMCVSVITEAELLFGLARRPEAKKIAHEVNEFLSRVDVLPLESEVAASYASLRADLQSQGITLAPFDLLIAAHALSAKTVLVTNDSAFTRIPGLSVEDWTKA
jgi:tRNA(fMet)-specific endonuclease VapC